MQLVGIGIVLTWFGCIVGINLLDIHWVFKIGASLALVGAAIAVAEDIRKKS